MRTWGKGFGGRMLCCLGAASLGLTSSLALLEAPCQAYLTLLAIFSRCPSLQVVLNVVLRVRRGAEGWCVLSMAFLCPR